MEAIGGSTSTESQCGMLRFLANLESIVQAQREQLAPQQGTNMLMPLPLVFPSVRQDFDVPTSHLIGAHGYCTQVRRQWGPQRGCPLAPPLLEFLPSFFI